MKKLYFFVALILTVLLASCGSAANKTMSVFYGVSSHAMFEASQRDINTILEQYDSLTLEKTQEECDIGTAFNVTIFENNNIIAHFWVDKNGVFIVDDEHCKIKAGSFDYNYLKKIYEESKGGAK